MTKEQAEMQLPPGKTCSDCYAYRFCSGIGCTWADRTQCDYHPRRFAPKQETPCPKS